ncbi:MAG: alpha,alpha-trehalose-phosphate synthase (UDP-forming), partial [Gammaproteobacteria bacterium]
MTIDLTAPHTDTADSRSSSTESRLVVVSNRVGPVQDAARAGGLAVALVDALRDSGGLWFGWSGEKSQADYARPSVHHEGGFQIATLPLTEDDYNNYYYGFANRTLWPLFHYRIDLTAFDRDAYRGYLRVNARFARMLEPMLEKDDRLWVHDYHLLAFGEELRRMGCKQPMGFFLHIPFPSPEVMTTLPVHDVLVRAMFAYDLIGFQTESDKRCFVEYVLSEAQGRVEPDGRISAFGRSIRVESFPIGIDTQAFVEYASTPEAVEHQERWLRTLKERLGIVGVDRLDYTKGLEERFRAFERLLENYPENRGRVSYAQIAPPSRSDVEEYVQLRHELEGLSGQINGEYSDFDWTPLRYINRAYSRKALAGIFRASRVGLITPLRDGMNLVAKEYVAAQSPDDPGVLILSRFAGAAYRSDGAMIVNPYDIDGVAATLQAALNMPLGERLDRWQRLMNELTTNDVGAWRQRFM